MDSNEHQEKTGSDAGQAPPVASVVPAEQQPQANPVRNQCQGAKQNSQRLGWPSAQITFDFLVVVFTGALAVTSYLQWHALRDTLTETKNLAIAAKQQAGAAVIQADAAKIQATTSADGVQVSRLANELAGRGITQNLETARRDQRAWLSIQGCTISKEPGAYPTDPNGKLRPTFTTDEVDATAIALICGVVNTGKTPAVNVKTWALPSIGIPLRPNWKTFPATAAEIVFPGDNATVFQINIEKMVLSPIQNTQYRDGKQRVFFALRVEYDDALHFHHWTEACYSRKFNDALMAFTYCGGGIDGVK